MAKKLFEKAGLIQMPSAAPKEPVAPKPAEEIRAKTAPGSMLHFMSAQSTAIKEAESLREELARYEGALPVRQLDPRLIRPSAWANRHAASFEGPDFAALKDEIAAANGNVQPIKVRPIQGGTAAVTEGVGQSNPLATGGALYEIVFGHRRHRACLELGIPVLAMVAPVNEQELFVAMERENRARKDLSAWEQGMMYARALDAGLYASNRQLAAAIGRDLGDVGKALSLARLPKAVVDAFSSPLDLQFRWAKLLNDAQQKDPDGLMARAKALAARTEALTAKQVLERLLDMDDRPLTAPVPEQVIQNDRERLAVIGSDDQGRTVVRFQRALSDSQRDALAAALREFFALPK
ncbi:ParB/RepB/Spo0J family partition protein [Aquincola tertiaricarbonis]|uniref:ParB/RepB/Spo0J family partition protein n=1 Tax=Aquincola tertiaricarbonis TaxID=391953 RepID=A0ABY4RZ60_AQUTE|nr:ParB/RepB/Spo0J family partition protein [Aquincola tertiaricarbonis]URI05767.1 ParB/RepB/Spo0J family partition protein [Aquincola tertiaricarbonis]